MISRRRTLQTLIGVSLGSVVRGADEKRNVITEENARPGTRDWMLTKTGIDPSTKYRCPRIEGYASRASVKPGERIAFHVSTNPASRFTIEIYRSGYYGGTGGRFIAKLGSFDGAVQTDPAIGPKRVRVCEWPVCAEWEVPADVVSGVYLGKLTAESDGWQSYIIFIVRDDRHCDFLFQCSDNTWQAYNRWPSQFALYDDGKNESQDTIALATSATTEVRIARVDVAAMTEGPVSLMPQGFDVLLSPEEFSDLIAYLQTLH